MIEGDVAPECREAGSVGIETRLPRGVKDVAQPRQGDACLLEVLPELHQFENRAADPAGEHVEGHQLADGQLIGYDQMGAPPDDTEGHQFVNQSGHLVGDVVEVLTAE